MKQCFTHRLPSHVTLLRDPWPEDFSEVRDKVGRSLKTAALPLVLKGSRRKVSSGTVSS